MSESLICLLVVKRLANKQFKALKLLLLFKNYHLSQWGANLSIYQNVFKNFSLKIYISKIASSKNAFSKLIREYEIL